MLWKTPKQPACSGNESAKHCLAQTVIALIAFMFVPPTAMADPPDQDAGQAPTGNQEAAQESTRTNNGGDITRPQTAFEMRFSGRTTSNETSETNRGAMLLRLSSKIPPATDWRMGLLAQVPILEETMTTFNPLSVDHQFGLGDATFQAFVAHDLNERWAIAVGARLIARTAEDDLGSGKWQIMPGFGVRYSLPELGADSYFVPVIRYAMSFAGDPAARRISEAQIAPTSNLDLPGPWFLTFYPSNDIRIISVSRNLVRPDGCSSPLMPLTGAKLTRTLQILLEGSGPIVKEYPVYNFKAELRVRMLF